MATASTATTVSLKLLIDTKGKRVLYAEAGKDFVDFLFNILLLPLAVANEGGYVKGFVTYTIMDDLTVTALSTISSIAMLNKFKVQQVDALEEKVVDVGIKEGVEILKASLQSKTVLTSVFLTQKAWKTGSK
ncbi:hypothetical protein GOBAR_DD31799 [Gossypium barbadense]|nr:hypothetical protein GOBAR_DD31799 [Gossypium barbadense]